MHFCIGVWLKEIDEETFEKDVEKALRPFYYENVEDAINEWCWDWCEIGGRIDWRQEESKPYIKVADLDIDEYCYAVIVNGELEYSVNPDASAKRILRERGIRSGYVVWVDCHGDIR